MRRGYLLAGAAAAMLLSSCNPPVDPAQGWDEPSAYVVKETYREGDPDIHLTPNQDEPPTPPQDGGEERDGKTGSLEEFFEAKDEIKQQYGIDYDDWKKYQQKNPGVVEAVLEHIPEERKAEYVMKYFIAEEVLDTLENLDEWLAPNEDFNNYAWVLQQECEGPDSWVLYPSGTLRCKENSKTYWDVRPISPVGFIVENGYQGTIILDSGTGHDALTGAELIREELEKVLKNEDTVEILIAEQIRQAFEELLGESVDTHIEFEQEGINWIPIFYEGEEITSFDIWESDREEVSEALDALVKEYPGITYSIRGLAGRSLKPALVNERTLTSTLATSAHEMAHHLVQDYPLNHTNHGSEEEKTLEETSVGNIENEVVFHLLSTKYAYYEFYLLHQTDYRSIFKLFADGGIPRLPSIANSDNELDNQVWGRYGQSQLGIDIIKLRHCSSSLKKWYDLMKMNDTAEDLYADLRSCQETDSLAEKRK